MLMILDCI